MSTAIKIEIADEPTDDVVHRFRNFGEAVWTALRETCSVSLDEIDHATTSFVVRDIRKADIGMVTQTMKRELRRHHFENTATLTRL